MKLVLDLITHLTGRNPDKEESKETNKIISDDLTAIISGRSVKPVIKSALKALEHLLGKKVLGLAEIGQSYAVLRSEESEDALQLWRSVFFDLFHWMKMHFVCPVASKVISCIFRLLRQREDNNGFTLQMWHQWLLTALRKEPTLLGGIKNYVLLPFFKDEGAEAIQFLKLMDDNSSLADIDLGPPALLHLAALETAKRAGLVEEPGLPPFTPESSVTDLGRLIQLRPISRIRNFHHSGPPDTHQSSGTSVAGGPHICMLSAHHLTFYD